MLEQENRARIKITQISDTALACVSLLATAYVRSLYPNAWGGYTVDTVYYWPLFLVNIVCFTTLLSTQGFYAKPLSRTWLDTAWILAKACTALFLLMVLVQFAFKLEYSRPVLLAQSILTFVLVMIREVIVGLILRSKGMRDGFARRVLVVASGAELDAFSRQFSQARYIDVVEYIDIQAIAASPIELLVTRLHQHAVNSVIVSLPLSQLQLAERIIHVCEEEGVETILMAEFLDQKICTVECSRLFGQPVLVYSTISSSAKVYENIAKRCLDLMGGLALLLLISPLLFLVAIAIKLTSSGPVLFKQVRAGLNGREFTMVKFRTMISNAEAAKDGLMALNEMSGPVFKIKNDPRLTSIGRVLRKYSIDEMPQFWNVVCGDMSLVGPRPLPVDEVKRFENRAYRRRMSMKPGLTCLWQISGRNNITDFDEWMKLDIEYIDTWSLRNDCKILIHTIPAVLSGRGAK